MTTNKYKQTAFIVLLLVLVNTTFSFASEFESSKIVKISNIHTIEGDLYAWGEKVTINGVIKGDFIGGGKNLTINGEIRNSTNIFSNEFVHSGEINGSLRLFVNDGIIDGTIDRSGLFFGNQIKIGKNAVIGNDLHFYGGNIDIEGTVHGDVTINATDRTIFLGTGISINQDGVYISGTIDGDLTITGKNIHIISPALIKGNLKYISQNQAHIDINSGVTILGNTTWDLPENAEEETDSLFLTTVKSGSRLLAAFLFGILLMSLCKKYVSSMVFQLNEKFVISSAVGFISLALLVISLVILVLTLILVVVGFTLMSEDSLVGGAITLAISTIMIPISSIAIVTITSMIYSGKIILALLLGYTIVGKFKTNPSYLSKSQLFIGLFLFYLMFAIPYVGTLLFIIISIIGMGAIILGIKDCHRGLNSSKVNVNKQVGI